MALGRVVRRFLALLALGWVLLLVALLASIDEPPVPEAPSRAIQGPPEGASTSPDGRRRCG